MFYLFTYSCFRGHQRCGERINQIEINTVQIRGRNTLIYLVYDFVLMRIGLGFASDPVRIRKISLEYRVTTLGSELIFKAQI